MLSADSWHVFGCQEVLLLMEAGSSFFNSRDGNRTVSQQVSQQLNHGMQMVTIGKISSCVLGLANSRCSIAACTGMAKPLHCTCKTGKRLVKHQHRAEDSSVSRLFGWYCYSPAAAAGCC